jgi:TorA maturation chaperone TorD
MNEFSILCRVLGSLFYRQPQDPLLVPLYTLIREGSWRKTGRWSRMKCWSACKRIVMHRRWPLILMRFLSVTKAAFPLSQRVD